MSPSSESGSAFRVGVVGGGISGLSAAHRLLELGEETARPIEVTLFERQQRLGGMVGTERVEGYLLERGGDMFVTDKPWAVELAERLELGSRIIGTEARYRRSLVVHEGRPTSVPPGFMLMAPARIGSMLRTPILSWGGKLRMGLDLVLPRGSADDETVADFVTRRFGRQVLDRLVQPLVGGIYTADPEKLSLRATLPRFLEMEAEHRSLYLGARARARTAARQPATAQSDSGARYGMFVSFEDGMAELMNALEHKLREGARVKTATDVLRLSRGAEEDWCLHYRAEDEGEEVEERFDALILAVPTYAAAALLGELTPQLSSQLGAIEYASSIVVASGHRLEDIEHPLQAFGMVVPIVEKRGVLAVSFSSRKFPGRAPEGRVLLRSFVGGALQPQLCELDDAAVEQLVTDELRALLGVRGPPDFMRIMRYHRAMPQYHLGHLERVTAIEKRVETHRGLALAGNAYRGVGIPDCIHSGECGAERIARYI